MTYDQLWEEAEKLNDVCNRIVLIQTRIRNSETLSKDSKAILKNQLHGIYKTINKEVNKLYKRIRKIDKNFEAKEE